MLCELALPKPYYAVIFTSVRNEKNDGYSEMAEEMLNLAQEQKGFLGVDSVRQSIGITVSYWKSLEDINAWKANIRHQEAQKIGKEKWYSHYTVRVCKVEYDYQFKI